jgi:biopolymer transport protein ExbD
MQSTDLPLTPLIDTALTLLIIFMIASPMMHQAIKVNLPQGSSGRDTSVKRDLVVSIDEHEKLYLNNEQTTLEALIAELSQEVIHAHEGTLYMRADSAVRYGYVLSVVDRLKAVAGVKAVALATQPRA